MKDLDKEVRCKNCGALRPKFFRNGSLWCDEFCSAEEGAFNMHNFVLGASLPTKRRITCISNERQPSLHELQ